MTPEQYHEIGQAVGEAEAAIEAEPEALAAIARQEGVEPAHLVGEMVEYALARHGFVIVASAAAVDIARRYEQPRQLVPRSTLSRLQ